MPLRCLTINAPVGRCEHADLSVAIIAVHLHASPFSMVPVTARRGQKVQGSISKRIKPNRHLPDSMWQSYSVQELETVITQHVCPTPGFSPATISLYSMRSGGFIRKAPLHHEFGPSWAAACIHPCIRLAAHAGKGEQSHAQPGGSPDAAWGPFREAHSMPLQSEVRSLLPQLCVIPAGDASGLLLPLYVSS